MLRLLVDDLETRFDGVYPHTPIYKATSFLPEGFFFNPYYKRGQSDGRKRLLKAARGSTLASVPTGLLSRVVKVLTEHSWPFEIVDNRGDYSFTPEYKLENNEHGTIDLSEYPYDYQAAAVDAVALYGRGIIKVATSGGKTEIGAGIIKSAKRKALWLINRKYLAYQTRDRLAERLGVKVGFVGDSLYDPADVVVGMSQTLSAMLQNKDERFNFLRDFQLVIGDEVHHLESGQWYNIFSEIAAPIRVGLSATPTDGGYGMYLEAQTGPVIIDIPSTELLERDIIVQPNVWFATIDAPALGKREVSRDVYDKGIVYNTPRNEMVCHIAKILIADRKPPLILSSRLNQVAILCEMLESSGVRVGKITGSVKYAEREEMLSGLRTGSVQAIVGMTSILGEGISIGDIRSIVNACGSKGGSSTDSDSGRQIIQILGRGLRRSKASEYLPDKTAFDYVDFLDLHHKSLREASLSRLTAIEGQGYGKFVRRWNDYVPAPA